MTNPSHYIDGAWVAAKTTLPVVNPSDGQTIGQIGRGGADEIDAAVRAAIKAQIAPQLKKA